MPSPTHQRADEYLVSHGLAESRTQAKDLIEQNLVLLGGSPIKKASKRIQEGSVLELVASPRFVSRGGEKLESLLKICLLELSGKIALDVGASTGGFTDCLLQHDVAEVTCIDVGHGQLHPKLQEDPRVTNLEKINAREIDSIKLPYLHYPIIVMDLSFISLKKVLEPIWRRLEASGHLIVLIKPQFEAPLELIKQGSGIIRDATVRAKILQEMVAFCERQLPGAYVVHTLECPIAGKDGNREYLLCLKKNR
ncbi:MAG: TlyA family rRNA (cytidine-2'-O)-methyltransferase [Opitutales bacterium]|tara:strand:+ start:149 stop:904 length:756 start_codon:yes stop_codon:yes gene_type:complete